MLENFKDTDDSALPRRNPESYLAQKVKKLVPYSVDSWSPELLERCIVTRTPFVMPESVHEKIIHGEDIQESDWPELAAELKDSRSFIRLGGASPKDALAETAVIAKPAAILGFHGAMLALSSSERTFDLLVGHWHASIPATVWVSPFVPISPQDEWRCVILDGQLRAISQYYWPVPTNITTDRAQNIKEAIVELYRSMKHLLPETCVMDVVAQNRAAGFLEMNPLAQSDLCLIPVKLPEQLTVYYRTAKTIEV
jgi:hypothetical protein